MKIAIVSSVALLLAVGCAQPLPMPTDVQIQPPAANVLPSAAAFLGVWKCDWNGVVPSTLIVEKVTANRASVIYTQERGFAYQIEPVRQTFHPTIKDNSFTVGDPQKLSATFTMRSSDTIYAERYDATRGWFHTCYMKKVSVPESGKTEQTSATAPVDPTAFIGVWKGIWNKGGLPLTLTVEQVQDNRASGIYAWGTDPYTPTPGRSPFSATIDGNELTIAWKDALRIFTLGPDGSLHGERYANDGSYNECAMTKLR